MYYNSQNNNLCFASTYSAIRLQKRRPKTNKYVLVFKKRLKIILDEIIVRARNVGNDFTSETGEEIYNTFVIKRKEEYRELKEQRRNKHRKK